MNNSPSQELQLLIIGDSQSGKNQLCSLLTNAGFNRFLFTGNQNDIQKKMMEQGSKVFEVKVAIRPKYILKLLKMPGDKHSRNYLDIYLSQKCSQINGIIYVFDLTNLKTLENFKKWINILLVDRKQELNFQEDEEEIESLIQYQSYKGFLPDQLLQLPIILVGSKADRIGDLGRVRRRIIKQIESLFKCSPGENLFLISCNQISAHHSEFQRLDQSMSKILQKESNICLNSLKKQKISFERQNCLTRTLSKFFCQKKQD